MGRIWMPGGGGGADLDVITAGAGDVLSGKVIVDQDGNPITGTIPVKSAIASSINCGGSVDIPAGYYPTAGKVQANSLASQTAANAGAGQILSGYTAYVNGAKITGSLAVQSVLSFSVAPYSSTQITFTWKNPAKGAFSGVIIVGKTGSYPTSISDGTRWYKGSGNNTAANGISSATVSGFTAGTAYYFRCFSYAVKSNAEWVHATSYTATATPAKGSKVFKASGSFTVPAGVRSIDIFCVGGGGAGGSGNTSNTSSNQINGGGGGGGYTAQKLQYAVTPGTVFSIVIGAGGAGGSATSGASGGTTSFGSVVSAKEAVPRPADLVALEADPQGLIETALYMAALAAQMAATEVLLTMAARVMEQLVSDREQQHVSGAVHQEHYMQEAEEVRLLEL